MTSRTPNPTIRDSHTPGKWEYGIRADGSIWISIGDPATGPHYQFDLFCTPADARLMAAAPDLYRALMDVLDKMGALCNPSEIQNLMGSEEDGNRILAAIATVEGR